jgi:hypothetical protein
MYRRTHSFDKFFSSNKPCQAIFAAIIKDVEAETVSETSGAYPQMTRLVAREEFIEFSRLQ